MLNGLAKACRLYSARLVAKAITGVIAGASVVLLSGCETLELDRYITQEQPLTCPPAQIVEQASSYTQFPDGYIGDVSAGEYTLRFLRLSGECRFDDGAFEMDVYMTYVAVPQASMASNQQAEAEWFMVLLQDQGADSDPKVLSRNIFHLQADLKRASEPVVFREHYVVSMPNLAEGDLSRLWVMGGFVLSDEEWDFNESNPFYFQ